jgi:ArsR family transcriptional regulator, arsenate/arsenite/antimonite-responsive transcriptional repressor
MVEHVDILKALSDLGRLRILKILEIRSLCVCEIKELIGLATSTISSHLNVLKNAGIIKDEKDGKWINYSFLENPEPFFSQIWPAISKELDKDPVIVKDQIKATVVDRYQIIGNGK